MRPFVFLICLGILCSARAEENHYQALSKTLTPFLAVFAKDRKSDDRAFSLKVRIEQSTDLPAELRGAKAEISVEAPDKLRLHGPLLGETFTLVRDDEKIWIAPGAKARALLDAVASERQLPPAEKKYKLGDFRLPFPEKHLGLLTALLSAKDQGSEMLDGVECRVLDVTLMPELAEQVGAEGWVARVWIRPDFKPARLTLARKGWNIVLRFDDVEFARDLPNSTWKPGGDEAGDVLELSPKEYSRFLQAIGGAR